MKKPLSLFFLIFIMILGISSLVFVVRMIWFPPTAMGMMMGKKMMFHHMYFWFSQMFLLCVLFFGLTLLISRIMNKRKEKK